LGLPRFLFFFGGGSTFIEGDLFRTFVNSNSIVGNSGLLLGVESTKIVLFATRSVLGTSSHSWTLLSIQSSDWDCHVFVSLRLMLPPSSKIDVQKGIVSSNQVLPQAALVEWTQ
jgi:hypothetical protein